MSFIILGSESGAAGVWCIPTRNDVGNFRNLKNKTLVTRCAVEIPLAALADAPIILFDLGRNHDLYPRRWVLVEQDGKLLMWLDIPKTQEVIREKLPYAKVIASCTEVLR